MASDVSDPVRREIARRAAQRCEYCLIHESDSGFSFQVDHVISRKHGGSSTLDNLAYCCVPCNRSKGADIASVDEQTGQVVRLFHPRRDLWIDHFEMANSVIRGRTTVGDVTIRLLKFNAQERVAERQALQALGRYAAP